MLAIRLQRTGRSGHSQFRLVAQDSRFSPKRGRIVAYLGSYDPHTKEVKLDAEKVSKYLDNGAQPSESAAKLLKKEGVKLPGWVKTSDPKQRDVRNPEKRRSTRPAEPKAEAAPEAPAAEETTPASEPQAEETAAEQPAEPAGEETSAGPTPEETTAKAELESSAEAPAETPETPAEQA